MTICYHGTNAEAVEKIREEGFRIYTYFARSLQDALGFGGPHILEVVFYDADIEEFGWQFKAPEVVSPDRILRYYTLEKEMQFEIKELGERVFKSNMVETPRVLASEPSQDAWIDEIFNWADDHFLEGKFETVDEKLADLDAADLGLTLAISWLTITFPAKDKLKNRAAFYEKCRAFVVATQPKKD
jgi:hypothetical protein